MQASNGPRLHQQTQTQHHLHPQQQQQLHQQPGARPNGGMSTSSSPVAKAESHADGAPHNPYTSPSGSGAVRTARKQWSSCDFCRERKKKCDAREQKAVGKDKCSRCQENDCACTFSYVSQKNTIRNQKRTEAQARRLSVAASDAVRPGMMDPTTGFPPNIVPPGMVDGGVYETGFPQFVQDPQAIHVNAMHPGAAAMHQQQQAQRQAAQQGGGIPMGGINVTPGKGQFDFNGYSHVDILPDFAQLDDFDPMIAIDDPRLDQTPDLNGTGHRTSGHTPWTMSGSEPSMQQTPISHGSVGPHGVSSHGPPSNHGKTTKMDAMMDGDYVETIPRPASPVALQSEWLQRPSSGLSPEMELHLLREYMDLTHPQMPILDRDIIFLRHRCGIPTPLPRYLLLTLMACGGAYSAARPESLLNPMQARALYDEAKRELLQSIPEDNTIDAIAALVIIAFHWQDELSGPYRQIIQNMAIAKIQALKLHTNEGIVRGRSQREIGVLKWMVWLQYYTEVFGWWDAETDPYLNQDISLDLLNAEDNDFLLYDYLSGERRKEITDEDLTINLHFSRMFSELALLQNDAIRRRRRGRPLHSLIPELQSIRMRTFPSLLAQPDKIRDPETGMIKPLAAGMLALNVAFWYCWLYVHFDVIRPYLKVTDEHATVPEGGIRSPFNRSESQDAGSPVTDHESVASGAPPSIAGSTSGKAKKRQPPPTDIDPHIIRGAFAACVEACSRNMDIFDAMVATGRVKLTTQILRDQLYYAGRHLQILYKNKVPGIGAMELARWERCLEISERVWGLSSRGLDLSSMSLEEIE